MKTHLYCIVWAWENTMDIVLHDDVIKWKHFPHYWPFVWGIHQSLVNSLYKGQWRRSLMFSLICTLNKWLSKQSCGWWFETPSCSLWHHHNVSRNYVSLLISSWMLPLSFVWTIVYIDGKVQDCSNFINPSPPSAAYKCQWIGWALAQIMALRLVGAKPLSEPMLEYHKLDHKVQTSVKF